MPIEPPDPTGKFLLDMLREVRDELQMFALREPHDGRIVVALAQVGSAVAVLEAPLPKAKQGP